MDTFSLGLFIVITANSVPESCETLARFKRMIGQSWKEEPIRDWGILVIAASRKLQTQQLSKCNRTDERVKSQACGYILAILQMSFVLSRHSVRGLANLEQLNDSQHQILAPEGYSLLNQYRILISKMPWLHGSASKYINICHGNLEHGSEDF